MTAKELAEVCANITIKLVEGGVPQELALLGVKQSLIVNMTENKDLPEDERRDVVAEQMKKDFSFCLQS